MKCMKPNAFLFPNSQGGLEGHFLRKCKGVAELAGLDGSTFTLHSWRRTWATRLHESGVSARTIQYRLGHSNLKTTLRYLGVIGDDSVSEAEKEFREAASLDSSNAEAHSGLARVYEADDNPILARSEAEAALRLKATAEAFMVLARLDLRDNRTQAAVQNVDQALRLEPANAPAQALKRAVAAKLAEKAQPLQNQ